MADQKLRVDITAKDRTRQAFSRVQKSLARLKNSLFSLKGLIGAAFGVIAVRALVKFVTNTVKAADAIVKTADAIGISTDKLQELRFAADLSGVSVDKLDKALLGFSKRVGEARANTGSLVTFLKATNVELLGSVQSAQTVDEAFALIIKAARSMGNEMDQSALLAAAFGSKAGVALKNLLPDMEALMAEARKLGIVIDEDLLRGAAEMNDEFTRLGAVLSSQLTTAVLKHKDEIIDLTKAFILAIPQIALVVQNFAMWIGLLERPLKIQITNAISDLDKYKKALEDINEGSLWEEIQAKFKLAFTEEFQDPIGGPTFERFLEDKITELQDLIRFLKEEERKREQALLDLDATNPANSVTVIPPAATQSLVDHDAVVKRITESIEGQTRALELELDTLDKSTAFKAKATIAERVLADVRRVGIELTDPEIQALNDLIDKYGLLHETLEAEKAAMAEATRVAEENEQQIRSLADSIETTLIDSLADLSTGFENWRDVARSALRDVIRAMLQFISVQSGMGGGGGIGNLIFKGLSTLFTPTPMSPTGGPEVRQLGGPLGAGQSAIVGERGPELFVPRSAGHVVPNGQFGGGVTVNQTVNLSTGVQATVRAEVMGMLPQIAATTKSAVLSARVRGGVFANAFEG